jgi:hypothetical protein
VENGQIKLLDNVQLPEQLTVYVIIPDLVKTKIAYIASPRLAQPEQAADFRLEVSEES